jgi:hypothetical protein
LPTPFVIRSASSNNKSGLLFYGVNGKSARCSGRHAVHQDAIAARPVASGGTAPPANDCTGIFSMDFTFAQSGRRSRCTRHRRRRPMRGRDPVMPPNGTTLSNALDFVMRS